MAYSATEYYVDISKNCMLGQHLADHLEAPNS